MKLTINNLNVNDNQMKIEIPTERRKINYCAVEKDFVLTAPCNMSHLTKCINKSKYLLLSLIPFFMHLRQQFR